MRELKLNTTYIMTLASVIFVSLIFNLFIRNEMDFSYLMLDLSDIGNLSLQNKNEIFQYIFSKRLKQFLLLVILIKAFGSDKIFDIMTIVFGGILGLMISVQVYYLGLLGLIILILYLLPHYILYFLGIYYGYREKIFNVGSDNNLKKFIIFSLFYVIGVILECNFMNFFLKNFYQYMVS